MHDMNDVHDMNNVHDMNDINNIQDKYDLNDMQEMNYNDINDLNINNDELGNINAENNYDELLDINNNDNLNMPVQMNNQANAVLNDFKLINEQTQKLINNTYQKNPMNALRNNFNQPKQNYNIPNINDIDFNQYDYGNDYLNQQLPKNNQINTNAFNPISNLDNIDILKIQNQVLNKSNLDLKNYNRCLKAELNSYKKMTLGNVPNSLSGSNLPMSQYDNNVNNYIETLKTSLNTSQMSNIELQELLKNVQAQKKELEQQYELLNQKIEECNLIVNGGQGPSDQKVEINSEYVEKCKTLENENENIKQEIESLNQEIENQKITNENLEQVIDSMNKESYNNEELLKNLKATIEKLKIQNRQGSKVNSQADLQISKNNNLMKMKQEEIKQLNDKINTLNSELKIIKDENKSLMEQMKLKQQENSKGDLMNQRLIAEINNLKSNNQVLEECLKDRRKTIMDLKQSLLIMSGVKDMNDVGDGIQNDDDSSNLNEKKKRLAELISDTKEKTKQLDEIKKNYLDIINKKNEKIKSLKAKLGIVS